MRATKLLSILLCAVMLFTGAACSRTYGNTPTAPRTTAPQPTEAVPTAPVNAPAEDEFVLDPLEFDPEEAELLGTIETEIYGEITIYFQQDRFFIFDSYNSRLFMLYAYSYEPFYQDTPVELIAEDANFDGYTDFMVLYSQANLNSYYYFFLWNMQKRTFEYYLPLSSVPSPSVDKERRRIISTDLRNETTEITTEYIWQDGNILPVGHGERTISLTRENEENNGPEEADTAISISDGHILSSVSLKINENSRSDWLCRIENELIVRLYSDTVDNSKHTHRFTFHGLLPGTTTVVLRYATSWNAPYFSQRILNITVNMDRTLTIKTVE